MAHLNRIFLLLFLTVTARAQESPVYAFTFNPPSGTAFVQDEKTRTVTQVAGSEAQVEEMSSSTRVKMVREDDGFTVLVHPLSLEIRQNGQIVSNPMVDVLQETNFTYRINNGGELASVEGYQQFIEGLKARVNPQLVEQVLYSYTEETMAEEERAEWQRRYGNFLGRNATVGTRWMFREPFQLPNGTNSYHYTVVEVSGMEVLDGHNRLRLDFYYQANPDSLAIRFPDQPELLAGLTDLPVPTFHLSGSGHRLLDPGTLLIYREASEKEIRTTVNVPRPRAMEEEGASHAGTETLSDPTQVTIRESSSITFRYR
ncbi:MAG TPA: hypothetical protein PKV71_04390 [Calditrichia bacterium]|nr:hypothetical protein [Calditrichota bacterium]HQU71955.1 hypothetical protein [Calditrichia bacterium]HQV31088.1 hypothetical protein [Calditrichia bacterium]